MNCIRAFVAVELAVEVKAELARLQAVLRRKTICPAKWVATDNTHLTLCFLGEIDLGQIEFVETVLTQTAASFTHIRLRMTSLGAFPSITQPRTVWVGLDGELDNLSKLHHNLEEGLRVVGYQPENRPFRPHLTIARIPSETSRSACQGLGEALRREEIIPLLVDVPELSLMKSTLRTTGAVHDCLCRVRLSGGLG